MIQLTYRREDLMNLFGKDPLPENQACREIGAGIAALQKGIERDEVARTKMAKLSGSFLKGALFLGAVVLLSPLKVPLMFVAAVGAVAGYLVTKTLRQGYDAEIARKNEMIATLDIEQEAARRIKPAPETKPAAPKTAKGDYNAAAVPANDPAADAERIAALEQRLRELKGAPIDLDKPKSIHSRTGFGA